MQGARCARGQKVVALRPQTARLSFPLAAQLPIKGGSLFERPIKSLKTGHSALVQNLLLRRLHGDEKSGCISSTSRIQRTPSSLGRLTSHSPCLGQPP